MSDETKFEIGNKAEQLYYSVFDLTTNRQHYPVKFRRLADKLQEYALDIHSDVLDANAYPTDSYEHKQKRWNLQTSAITKCNKFLTSEKWVALAHDIKFMTLRWRKT